MNSILKFINKNGFFYSVNFLLGLVIVLFLFVFSRTDGFIWLNQYHTYFLNHFFESITNLGDGLFIILTAVVFFYKNNDPVVIKQYPGNETVRNMLVYLMEGYKE